MLGSRLRHDLDAPTISEFLGVVEVFCLARSCSCTRTACYARVLASFLARTRIRMPRPQSCIPARHRLSSAAPRRPESSTSSSSGSRNHNFAHTCSNSSTTPLSAPRRVSPYLRPHPDRAPALERKDPSPRRVSLPCHCARPHARGESSSNLSAPPLVAFRALGSALLLLPARPPPHTESCRAAVARRRRCHLLCFHRRIQARAPSYLRAARPQPYLTHPILVQW